MTAPNIVNVTSIIGKTALTSLTLADTTIISNSASSGDLYKINSVVVANIDGSVSADVSIFFQRSTIDYAIAYQITVPANSTLILISKETGLYLEEGDLLYGTASANGDLQVICSYEIITEV